jgi:hypothetical protein
LKTGAGHGERQGRRSGLLRFAVLVPHRDSRRLVETRRPSLFAAGFLGAWSFPAAAPLALLARSLTASELKALAVFLREASRAGGRDGRITAGEAAEVPCPGADSGLKENVKNGLRFRGPVLDLPVPAWEDICSPNRTPPQTNLQAENQPDTVYTPFPSVVLCAALTPGGLPPGSLPVLPVFSFRAAAVANLVISPLALGTPGYSFRWKIGRLFWLPKTRPGCES